MMLGIRRFANQRQSNKLQSFIGTIETSNLSSGRSQNYSTTPLAPSFRTFRNTNSFHLQNIRFMSSSPIENNTVSSSNPIVELPSTETVQAVLDSTSQEALTTIVADNLPELGSYPSHYVMSLIDACHTGFGLPYWGSIAVVTVALRFALLPISISTMRSSARLAQMRPVLERLKTQYGSSMSSPEMRSRYQQEMKAVFAKYKANPLKAMAMPFVQLPIFVTFFFGLREMSNYFPAMHTGGALWFPDLSAPDPFIILPILNSLSFLAMIELGSDGIQVNTVPYFKWIMRGLAVAMTPMLMDTPMAVFLYWTTSNILSIGQTLALKSPSLRKRFDIPDLPVVVKDTATGQVVGGLDLKMKNNPLIWIQNFLRNHKQQSERAQAEIVDGTSYSPPSPSLSSTASSPTASSPTASTASTASIPIVKPQVTYSRSNFNKKK